MSNSYSKLLIILNYLKECKVKILILGISLIVVTFLNLSFPLLMKEIIDNILQKGNGLWVISRLYIFSIMILLSRELLQYYINYLSRYIGEGMTIEIRKKFYSHLISLPLSFFKNRQSGEICSRAFNDLNEIQHVIILDSLYFLKDILFLIGGLIIIFILSWKISLMMITGILIIALLTIKIGEKMREVNKNLRVKIGKINAIFQELFHSIKIIQAFVQENRMIERFSRESSNIFSASLKEEKIYSGFESLINFLNPFLLILIIWYGGHEIRQGVLTTGTLLGLLFYLYLLTNSIEGVSNFYVGFQKSIASLERIDEILSIKSEVKNKVGDQNLFHRIKGHIQFENVSLRYEDNYYVLKDINLEIKPGEILTLVGHNGSGKTSLINLLLGFYKPTTGNIKIDGWNIENIAIRSLREKIGFIPQEAILFNDSIYNNIAFGKQDASKEEIIEVAKKVGIHNFIITLPYKYETMIGEGGMKLSGGERQSIIIARTILKNPDVFILDEPTSSLDPKAEMNFYNLLMELIKGKTTIIVANRAETVINAQKIVVLNKGRIVERGSHFNLIKKKGYYYYLFQKQFQKIENASSC